jgi:hypothetical protein
MSPVDEVELIDMAPNALIHRIMAQTLGNACGVKAAPTQA